MRMSYFLLVKEGYFSHSEVYDLCPGRAKRGGHRDLPPSAVFSDSSHLRYAIGQGAQFWDWVL